MKKLLSKKNNIEIQDELNKSTTSETIDFSTDETVRSNSILNFSSHSTIKIPSNSCLEFPSYNSLNSDSTYEIDSDTPYNSSFQIFETFDDNRKYDLSTVKYPKKRINNQHPKKAPQRVTKTFESNTKPIHLIQPMQPILKNTLLLIKLPMFIV